MTLSVNVRARSRVAPRTVLALLTALVCSGQDCLPGDGIPIPLSPPDGAVLDNGCEDSSDPIEWDFDWADVAGASEYHLYVIGGPDASLPVIDDYGITGSSFHYECPRCYIIEDNRFGWIWRVQAKVGGVWGPWSAEGSFNVEPLDTDCGGGVNVVALLVDPLLVDAIRPGLDSFETDLGDDGWEVIEYTSGFATPQELREYLANLYLETAGALAGAILIGDTPHAYQWVQLNWGGVLSDIEFISFQYYSDLDGVFASSPGYTSPGGHLNSYDQHSGDVDWEIWIGLLPLYQGDYDLTVEAINRYFEKNHDYRSGALALPRVFLEIDEHHTATTMTEHNTILNDIQAGSYAWTPFSDAPDALLYFDSVTGLSVDQGYESLAAGLADFTVGDAHGSWAAHGQIDIDWIAEHGVETIVFWSNGCAVGDLDHADNLLTSVLYDPQSTVLIARGTTSDSGGMGTNADGFFGHNVATALSEGRTFGGALMSHVSVPLIWPWSNDRELHFGNVVTLGDPTLRLRE